MRMIYIVIHQIPGQSSFSIRQYAACGSVCRNEDDAAALAQLISKELGVQAWVLKTPEPKTNVELADDLKSSQLSRN